MFITSVLTALLYLIRRGSTAKGHMSVITIRLYIDGKHELKKIVVNTNAENRARRLAWFVISLAELRCM